MINEIKKVMELFEQVPEKLDFPLEKDGMLEMYSLYEKHFLKNLELVEEGSSTCKFMLSVFVDAAIEVYLKNQQGD